MSSADDSSTIAATVLVGDPVVPILDVPPNEDLALSDETAAAVALVGGENEQGVSVAAAEGVAMENSGPGAEVVEEEADEAPMDVDTRIITVTASTTEQIQDVPIIRCVTETPPLTLLTGGKGGESLAVDSKVTTTEEMDVTVSVVATTEEGKQAVPAEEESNAVIPAAGDDTKVETTTVTTTTTITLTETETSVVLTDVSMDGTPTLEESPSLGKREKPEESEGLAEEGTTADAAGNKEESPPVLKKAKTSDAEVPLDVQEVGVAAAAAAAAEEEEKIFGGDVQENPVQLGPKTFNSGVEMFTYFYDLLHAWVSNVDVNKYEFMVLSDLISKGHRDAEAKIGAGIKAFQIRFHPGWHSRCYYLVRTDGSLDDFSYRKCVDKIMPLPENLFSPAGDLLVDKLFGPEEDNKWAKKNKGRANFADGGGHQGGKHNRGGRGGRGDRRGGGRARPWKR